MKKVSGKSELKDYRTDSLIMACLPACKECMTNAKYFPAKCKDCFWGKSLRRHCRENSLEIPYEISIKKVDSFNSFESVKSKSENLKPYILKGPVQMMPKTNMPDIKLTTNDLDFIVKAKAMCDMNQDDDTCSPGADCIDCKWCAGVQMLDSFDPLARARLIDAADQKRWSIEDSIETEEKNEKAKKTKDRNRTVLGVVAIVSFVLPLLCIPALEGSGVGPWPIFLGMIVSCITCCIAAY